jgi:hypothetical protein
MILVVRLGQLTENTFSENFPTQNLIPKSSVSLDVLVQGQ